ncbi:MAG TPA: hypothetical protein VEN82_05635, partial [Actinomycetota bacterium]|nr:hypothetical protein [Actinomycetota bacterium]
MQIEAQNQATEGPGTTPGPLRAPSSGRGRLIRAAAKVALAALLAVGLFLVGSLGLFRHGHDAGPTTGSPAGSLAAPALAVDRLTANIDALQARLRANPSDFQSWGDLGFAYVQQSRVTADPTYYPRAEGALQKSLALHAGGNYVALAGMGALSAARHDFAGALAWAEKAYAANPYLPAILGVETDAYIELGQYQKGFATLQRMVNMRPDTSSYARVSYARELQGDDAGAIFNMELALRAAGTPADEAWASYYLGELYWNSGRPDLAEAQYRRGLQYDPGYHPNLEGVAKVEAARGDTAQAIRDYQAVVQAYPLPQFVIELGDLYSITGEGQLAQQQYALVHAEQRLFVANGVNVDIDIALFNADHGTDLAAGLSAARAEWGRRKSIFVADALAWELHANGQDAQALAYANRALELGTKSALLCFHRG